MKAGWKTVKLGELTSHRPICYGVLKPGKLQEAGVPLIRITDIAENKLDESDIYLITSKLSQEFGRSVLTGGEVLLSIQGTIGRVAICPPHMKGANVSRTLAVIAPDERASSAYVRYWLLSLNGTLPTCGSTRASLNIGAIRELEIPLPPLAEQKRIVALLDEAFAGIDEAKAKTEANRKDANQLFRSHTQSIFTHRIDGWPTKELGDICDFEGGSQPPKSKFVYSQKTGYVRFLQIRDFGSEKYITFIPESKKNRHCKEHDIMIARYGASVGKILTGKTGSYNVALMKTLPDLTQLDRDFFHQYLTSGAFQDQLVKVAARSAQNGFSKDDIHGFPVPVPPLAEQRRVIQQLSPLSELCQKLSTTYGRKQTMLSDLKQSLLTQAFAGDLTV